MLFILAGLLLWALSHGFKRFAPGLREATGNGGRGMVSLGSLIAIGLMVYGYRTTEPVQLWQSAEWLHASNNVLMLFVVYLYAASGDETRLSMVMRHPMLNGMILWAFAHLLVNGDQISLLLFGGFIVWAVFTKRLIDRTDAWVLPSKAPLGKELGVLIAALVVYVFIVHVHAFLGPYPLWWGWNLTGPLAAIVTPIF